MQPVKSPCPHQIFHLSAVTDLTRDTFEEIQQASKLPIGVAQFRKPGHCLSANILHRAQRIADRQATIDRLHTKAGSGCVQIGG